MSDEEDLDIQSGVLTSKVKCSTLRKNAHVVLKGRPCKIVELSASNTGKHGHSKVHLVGIDVFSGKKIEEVTPSTHDVDIPHIQRVEYKLNGIDNTTLLLSDEHGNSKDDVAVPDGDLGYEITQHVDNGDSLVLTILSAMNEQACIGYKNA